MKRFDYAWHMPAEGGGFASMTENPEGDYVLHDEAADEITRLRAELAEAREVKPLEWDATSKVYRASVFGVRSFYRIEKSRGSKGWGLLVEFDNDGPLDFLTHWPTLQAAKSAAQADYASRILAALVKGE